jgi:membrane-bound metal-dependent hydrolase YbcI (DUF457 family)
MNTPTHVLIGAALFARRAEPRITLAAFAGGLAPDLAMFALVLWSVRIAGIPEHQVFGVLYFSDAWQRVFAVDHSFFVWGGLFAVATLRALPVLRAFAGAGLAHAAADFVTHNDDARRQLWPITDWVFRSPVSYWEPRFYGNVLAPVEVGLVILLTVLLLLRLTRWWERALTLAAASVLIVPILLSGGFHGLHGPG